VVSVDRYFKQNIFAGDEPRDDNRTAMFRALHHDEYDDIYGISRDAFDDFDDRHAAYSLMAKFPEKVNVTFRCKHNGPYHRHHPDYSRPFDVELICIPCHSQRHAAARQAFNPPYSLGSRKNKSITGHVAAFPPSGPSLTATTDTDRGNFVNPQLDRLAGREDNEPTPFKDDSDDLTFQYATGESCNAYAWGSFVQVPLF